jgi:hypothetical protein
LGVVKKGVGKKAGFLSGMRCIGVELNESLRLASIFERHEDKSLRSRPLIRFSQKLKRVSKVEIKREIENACDVKSAINERESGQLRKCF